MYLLKIRRWHVHIELDWNIWLLGVSWNSVPSAWRDIGIYFGPLNFQFEKYDRHAPPEFSFRELLDDVDDDKN